MSCLTRANVRDPQAEGTLRAAARRLTRRVGDLGCTPGRLGAPSALREAARTDRHRAVLRSPKADAALDQMRVQRPVQIGLGHAQREALKHRREQAVGRQPQEQVPNLRQVGFELVHPAVVLH